jgi:transposase-like protein
MTRPDLDTLACVHPACQRFRRPGEAHLTVRKVYGHDRLRLLRCRTGGEEFSERRGSALLHTKLPAATAEEVITHLGEGCRVRATARLVQVATETVAPLLRVAGRHASRFPDQQVHGLTPRALAFDAQWSFVKKSRSAAATMTPLRPATWGIIPPSRRIASWWSPSLWASGPKSRPKPWCTRPSDGAVRGICRRSSPRPTRALSPPSEQPLAVGIRPLPRAPAVGLVVPSCAGPKDWLMGR